MKRILYPILFILIIVASSCEREATVAVPETKPIPVLYSFLSPDSKEIRVSVTMSQPVFGNASSGVFNQVQEAVVSISDQLGNTKIIPFSSDENCFYLVQTEYPILTTNTYTIEAKWGDYKVTGKTTVPLNNPNFDSAYAEEIGASQWGDIQYRFLVKWTDIPGETNYYRTSFEEVVWSSGFGDKMFSDVGKDGQVFSDKFDYYSFSGSSAKPLINAYLINCDKVYYEYHRRRLNYFGDDPFSEPVQQYSNTIGGLGAIGSYRVSMKEIPIN
ncbi:MAG: DUF4249 domain-containing protein [Bacteroidia bacterium]|nr:DUF4249 domain-containing protein [Bacteroidia bacterium]MCF8425163.1 DUF4249 domain-containing protein [Bacteroidia bacterium]